MSVGPNQYGVGSRDHAEHRKFPHAVIFRVDQLNPVRPWRDVEGVGRTKIEQQRPALVQEGENPPRAVGREQIEIGHPASEQSVAVDPEFLLALDVEEQRGASQSQTIVRLASAIEADWLLEDFEQAVKLTDELEWNASAERVERVARQTEHDARDSYLGVLSEISRVKALRRAVESNATALNATEAGYEAGTRTAVDVVESRRLWIQAQTDYSRSRYDYMINVLKLQQAAGILSVQSLNRLNSLLKEQPVNQVQ